MHLLLRRRRDTGFDGGLRTSPRRAQVSSRFNQVRTSPDTERRHVTDSVLAPVRSQFRALATTLLPETRTLDSAAWLRTEAIIDEMLGDRPPQTRRQVERFVRFANVLPVLRYGRTFVGLSEPHRTRFVATLEQAPFLAVRRGVWGLRTLVCMGVYGQDPTRPDDERPIWSDGELRRRASVQERTPRLAPGYDA